MSDFQKQCSEILKDDTLSVKEKIKSLKDLEYQAESYQRAASESNMEPNDGWQDDLRVINLALERLETELDCGS